MTFDEWFDEPEVFATRGERIMEMACMDALRATWDAASAVATKQSDAEVTPPATVAAIVEELDAAAERFTRYTNNPVDGLLSAAARLIEELSATRSTLIPLPVLDPSLLEVGK